MVEWSITTVLKKADTSAEAVTGGVPIYSDSSESLHATNPPSRSRAAVKVKMRVFIV